MKGINKVVVAGGRQYALASELGPIGNHWRAIPDFQVKYLAGVGFVCVCFVAPDGKAYRVTGIKPVDGGLQVEVDDRRGSSFCVADMNIPLYAGLAPSK